MVKPPWRFRWVIGLALTGASLASAGCGLVPRGRLDECHKQSQTLQAENARLKDQALNLRAQNQELTLRAVDDARQISAQDEAIEQLKQSVTAYQNDRDELARSFERLKSQFEATQGLGEVRVSSGPSPAPLAQRLGRLAIERRGGVFDEPSSTVSVPTDQLFEPGTDQLTPDARAWLKELAEVLAGPDAQPASLRVVGPADDSEVQRTGLGADDRSKARFLSLARAARVRDLLVAETGLDRARIALAGPEAARATGGDRSDRSAHGRRIEIQLDRGARPRDAASTPSGP